MPRIQFSDVVPPERRSIRDIPIPSGGKRKTPTPSPNPIFSGSSVPINKKIAEITEKKTSGAYEYYYPKEKETPVNALDYDGKSKSKKRLLYGSSVFLLIIIFVLGMMTVFASATIAITPKSEPKTIAMDVKGTTTIDEDVDTVRYEVIKLSKSKTTSIPSTGEEVVEEKARGKIAIYNNFSTEPQRLIVRTRFETKDGLLYRIPESVVVPGKSVKAGVETPGSIEVEIFADEAGGKYNIGKTDFTVPGFKSDANRYKNFYARSVTDMTGGFVGKRKTVSASEKESALGNMRGDMESAVKKELESKIPEGVVLLEGAIRYETKELPQKEDGSSVIIGEDITAYAMMLNTEDLKNKILTEHILNDANWQNIKPTIKDFSPLRVENLPEGLDAGNQSFKITGTAKVLADIDTLVISERLAGKSRKDTPKLIDEFAGISSITATIRPMWKRSFPENPSKIHVETVVGE